MKLNKKILQNTNFKKLWATHALSQLSSYALIFLVIGKTFEVTTSNVASGMLWVSFTLPVLFLSPFTGSLIDVWNKQKVLVLTNFLHWLTIYGFAICFSIDKPFLAHPLLFIYASISAINDPTEIAEVPNLIKKKSSLSPANAVLFFTDYASLIASSVFAGILLRIASLPVAISLLAALPLIASFIASTLPKEKIEAKPTLSLINELENLIIRVKDGYQFLMKNRLVIYGFSLLVMFRVLLATSIVLLPDFSKNILKISVYDAGFAVILPVAFGLLLGTFVLGKRGQGIRKWKWITSGLFLLATSFFLSVFLNSSSLILKKLFGILTAILVGGSFSLISSPAQSFIQEVTPTGLRGRTFSTLTFFSTLATIPSVFLATTLAEILGIKIFITLIGLILFLLGFYISKKGNEIILSSNNRH